MERNGVDGVLRLLGGLLSLFGGTNWVNIPQMFGTSFLYV
jgi:hypothetical protein